MSSDHQIDPRLIEALVHYERQAQVSRLLRGIVHNLSGAVQMARLPLDLLEIELQKQGAGHTTALKSMQGGMGRIFEELELLSAKSSQMLDAEPRDLNIVSLVREQLAFWTADMFFKHEIKHEVQADSPVHKVRGAYCDLASAFNGMMHIALEELQHSDVRDMLIKIWPKGSRIAIWVGDYKATSYGDPAGMEPFKADEELDFAQLTRYLISQMVKPWGGELGVSAQGGFGLILSLPQAG